MKAKPKRKLTPILLCACSAALLSACSHGPSESDAKAVIKERFASCQYLSLNDFDKTNGIPGDDPSNYRVEVKYTATLEPTDDQKDSLRHWIDDAVQAQKINAGYMQAMKADAAAHIYHGQDEDDYHQKLDALQQDMKQYLSVHGFFDKVANDCPNVDSQFIHSFYDPKGKFSDYTSDGITGTFTETIQMIHTDNGWQAAR
ncbi:hypothetical protein P5W99_00770 [Paraburkholderia sp. A3BS-1L]|uniref:hypothetical protein n=1 Tax=Paraburkholderia sp. A3BS-1L TaxID=3028375 RepID=UPI003DA9C4C7